MLKLRCTPWDLVVRPERGGRVTSLRLQDEELLEQGIGIDRPAAEGFVEGGAAGWDEAVPTVDAARYPGPGPWAGINLPDHGEAWRMEWSVVDQSERHVTTRCAGRLLPWQLERRLELTEPAVRASYMYENLGREPVYAYWCAHPLFKYTVGMEVGVEHGDALAHLAEGTSVKRFLRRGSVDRVRLAWPTGTAVEVAWDPALTPYVGVWVCNGDLGGYRQIAIEPATGGADRPHLAAPPPLLPPGASLRWWLEIRRG